MKGNGSGPYSSVPVLDSVGKLEGREAGNCVDLQPGLNLLDMCTSTESPVLPPEMCNAENLNTIA